MNLVVCDMIIAHTKDLQELVVCAGIFTDTSDSQSTCTSYAKRTIELERLTLIDKFIASYSNSHHTICKSYFLCYVVRKLNIFG